MQDRSFPMNSITHEKHEIKEVSEVFVYRGWNKAAVPDGKRGVHPFRREGTYPGCKYV